MTATLDGVTKQKEPASSAEQQAAVELVRAAKQQGLSLSGPEGLLKQLTKTVLETSLNEEMTEHLGYVKRDPAAAGSSEIDPPSTLVIDLRGPLRRGSCARSTDIELAATASSILQK